MTPAEVIRNKMQELGLRNRDLVPAVGSSSRVSEMLSGRRRPSLAQVRRLHALLGIPLADLIGLDAPDAEKEEGR